MEITEAVANAITGNWESGCGQKPGGGGGAESSTEKREYITPFAAQAFWTEGKIIREDLQIE